MNKAHTKQIEKIIKNKGDCPHDCQDCHLCVCDAFCDDIRRIYEPGEGWDAAVLRYVKFKMMDEILK